MNCKFKFMLKFIPVICGFQNAYFCLKSVGCVSKPSYRLKPTSYEIKNISYEFKVYKLGYQKQENQRS